MFFLQVMCEIKIEQLKRYGYKLEESALSAEITKSYENYMQNTQF